MNSSLRLRFLNQIPLNPSSMTENQCERRRTPPISNMRFGLFIEAQKRWIRPECLLMSFCRVVHILFPKVEASEPYTNKPSLMCISFLFCFDFTIYCKVPLGVPQPRDVFNAHSLTAGGR